LAIAIGGELSPPLRIILPSARAPFPQ